MEEDEEFLLLCKPEVFVYDIPPQFQQKGENRRAADWPESPIWEGQLKLFSAENSIIVQLEDEGRKVFTCTTVDQFPGSQLENVVDSCRYFALEIKKKSGGTKLIGLGFSDGIDSFDFVSAVKKHFSMTSRRYHAKESEVPDPKKPKSDNVSASPCSLDSNRNNRKLEMSRRKETGRDLDSSPPPPVLKPEVPLTVWENRNIKPAIKADITSKRVVKELPIPKLVQTIKLVPKPVSIPTQSVTINRSAQITSKKVQIVKKLVRKVKPVLKNSTQREEVSLPSGNFAEPRVFQNPQIMPKSKSSGNFINLGNSPVPGNFPNKVNTTKPSDFTRTRNTSKSGILQKTGITRKPRVFPNAKIIQKTGICKNTETTPNPGIFKKFTTELHLKNPKILGIPSNRTEAKIKQVNRTIPKSAATLNNLRPNLTSAHPNLTDKNSVKPKTYQSKQPNQLNSIATAKTSVSEQAKVASQSLPNPKSKPTQNQMKARPISIPKAEVEKDIEHLPIANTCSPEIITGDIFQDEEEVTMSMCTKSIQEILVLENLTTSSSSITAVQPRNHNFAPKTPNSDLQTSESQIQNTNQTPQQEQEARSESDMQGTGTESQNESEDEGKLISGDIDIDASDSDGEITIPEEKVVYNKIITQTVPNEQSAKIPLVIQGGNGNDNEKQFLNVTTGETNIHTNKNANLPDVIKQINAELEAAVKEESRKEADERRKKSMDDALNDVSDESLPEIDPFAIEKYLGQNPIDSSHSHLIEIQGVQEELDQLENPNANHNPIENTNDDPNVKSKGQIVDCPAIALSSRQSQAAPVTAVDSGPQYFCKICSSSFKTQIALVNHIEMEHEEDFIESRKTLSQPHSSSFFV